LLRENYEPPTKVCNALSSGYATYTERQQQLKSMKESIIKIFENQIYFTGNNSIDFSQTNFPSKGDFRFNPRKAIYWRVKGIFDSEELTLTLEVINYSESNHEKFLGQKLSKTIKKVIFKKLDWNQLEPQLSSYKQIAFKDIVIISNTESTIPSQVTYDEHKDDDEGTQNTYSLPEENESYPSSVSSEKHDERSIIVPFKSRVKIKDVTLIDGGVLFRRLKISSKIEEIEFQIENSNILGIFDQVKYFLYKILNSRYFNISGDAIYQFGKILTLENIHSQEIDSIDENVINKVKYIQIETLPKLIKDSDSVVNSSILLNQEELKEVFKKEHEDSVLLAGPIEIIETLISQNPKSKNKTQLMFLSGKLQDPSNKILYTLKPEFGFVFFIIGNDSYHYCWELLNSHATYIWSFDKEDDDSKSLEMLEFSVNTIFESGRKYYKKALKQELIERDFKFHLISHPDKKDNELDRFKVWKSKLLEILD
jgi:hypothetical protein